MSASSSSCKFSDGSWASTSFSELLTLNLSPQMQTNYRWKKKKSKFFRANVIHEVWSAGIRGAAQVWQPCRSTAAAVMSSIWSNASIRWYTSPARLFCQSFKQVSRTELHLISCFCYILSHCQNEMTLSQLGQQLPVRLYDGARGKNAILANA